MNLFLQELKLAALSLSKRPGFVLTILLTLSLTLGALIAIFNLNYLLQVKALPYPNSEQLVVTNNQRGHQGQKTDKGYHIIPAVLHSYQQQDVFSDMAIMHRDRDFLLSHPEQPRVNILYSTPEYFRLTAPQMLMGRYFNDSEGLHSQQPVAVLSHQAWQLRFGSDANILGKSIQIKDNTFRVIGVIAQEFIEPQIFSQKAEVFLPWDFIGLDENQLTSWGNTRASFSTLAKLRDGVSKTQVEQSLSNIVDILFQQNKATRNDTADTHVLVTIDSLHKKLLGDGSKLALILMAAVIALLLIACANVINLFYSRAAEKQRTFAIQAALGARRSYLFRSMFAESFLLTFSSGLLGLLVAAWGFELLKVVASSHFNRLDELSIDVVSIAFSLLSSLLLALVFAFLSSRLINYNALKTQLQSSGKGSGLQISKTTRNVLIISQITVACLLLTGAFTVLQSAYSVITHPLGFNSNHVSSLEVEFSGSVEDSMSLEERRQIFNNVKQQLLQKSEIKQVSLSFVTPLAAQMAMNIQDVDGNDLDVFKVNFIEDNYFKLLQVPMIQGRGFTAEEVRDSSKVMIVTDKAADDLIKKGAAANYQELMTRYFSIGGRDPAQVVGIAKSTYDPVRAEQRQGKTMYLPYQPWKGHLLLRFEPNSTLSKSKFQSALKQIDSRLLLVRYESMEKKHQDALQRNKLSAGVAATLTFIALFLAGIGMYGVLSYSSQMRRYELGVRMSLGAKTQQVIAQVIGDNMKPVAIGLICSIALSLLIYAIARQHIVSLSEVPVVPLLAALPILIVAALFASYLPVKKIVDSDPVKALRNE